MSERRVTLIPVPGSSGQTPTGAMQFQDDWPGLFVRGNDAIMLLAVIEQLRERLVNHPTWSWRQRSSEPTPSLTASPTPCWPRS